MGVIYLADTNIVSEMMRPNPHSGVSTRWQFNGAQIAIAAITWHELLTGTFRLPTSRRRAAYESFLYDQLALVTPILPYDQAAAVWHARERSRLIQAGQYPSFPDGQIAAIAATNNLILVTRNTVDFADFADLDLENWLKD